MRVVKGCFVVGLAIAAATPGALAIELVDSVFQVSFTRDGQSFVYNDNIVPLLPGNACYNWYGRAAEAAAPIVVVERMTLPEAVDWSAVESDPNSPTEIENAGTVAVTTLPMTTDSEGWFSHGWCVAEGDPVGQHSIEVAVDGNPVAAFYFEVVPENMYTFAATSPDYVSRSANDVW